MIREESGQLYSVELNAAVVSATVMSRPTFPNAPVLGGAPASAPVEPTARPTALSRTSPVVSIRVLSPPGALDPEPVRGRTLPPGVMMLQSGNVRATIWFKKKSLFLGDYHIRGPRHSRREKMERSVHEEGCVFTEVCL
jgi:hypothetical protein